MAGQDDIFVQFIWHFHQPNYTYPGHEINLLPWVRLHAIKSYYDMAKMLQRFPDIHATCNFSGCLLLQLHDYIHREKRDIWWDLSLKTPQQLSEEDKQFLLTNFFSIQWDNCIRPLPRYWQLLQKRGVEQPYTSTDQFTPQDWMDLQVLFNLAWFGFSARDEFSLLADLKQQGKNFNQAQKQALLDLQLEIITRLPDLYRALVESEQIEISITPMNHPILPLLIDTDTASRATPHLPRPPRMTAPDDARTQVAEAFIIAEKFFGTPPTGIWPAEGAVSPEAIDLLSEFNCRWIATDEDILRHTRAEDWQRSNDLYRPWNYKSTNQPRLYFRDHELSDQFGFVYSHNSHEQAVDNFFERITTIQKHSPNPLISIILDGENPWEYYPNDGQYFLEHLYQSITDSLNIHTVLPTPLAPALLATANIENLSTIHSGSWIMGNYQIWIGHDEENTAWSMINNTRQDLVKYQSVHPNEDLREAWNALYIAQASDWFWWYGDDFSTTNKLEFDLLFRRNLLYVYEQIKTQPSPTLLAPICSTSHPQMNISAPGSFIYPTINGCNDKFYEWSGAAIYKNTGNHGSMFENTRLVDEVLIGFNPQTLFLRISFDNTTILSIHEAHDLHIEIAIDTPSQNYIFHSHQPQPPSLPFTQYAAKECIECAIDFHTVNLTPGDSFSLHITLYHNDVQLERHPTHSTFQLNTPDKDFQRHNWIV